MKIVLYCRDGDRPGWFAALSRHLPSAEVWAWTPETAARQADYAMVWAPPPAFFESQRGLKAVFNLGAGVDKILKTPDLAGLLKGAPLVRVQDGGMAVQMAEYACHALIRHTRGFDIYDRQQQGRVWKQHAPIVRSDWPVGVMGLGDIGTRVASAIAGFDFRTFGWSRSPHSIANVTTFSGEAQWETFLRECRVLVCVLPLSSETAGIINRRTMELLKPGAYVINMARGAHVVDADLLAAMESGHVTGAALDVFHDEPLPVDHPYWSHPCISMTPHIAAITLYEESTVQIAEKIGHIERGQSVDGVVDLARGY
jgi:glyoxylate/hydroxypyruvate reductase